MTTTGHSRLARRLRPLQIGVGLQGFMLWVPVEKLFQTQIGFEVKRDMPGLTGPAVDRLYRRGAEWLAGGELGDPLQTVD